MFKSSLVLRTDKKIDFSINPQEVDSLRPFSHATTGSNKIYDEVKNAWLEIRHDSDKW